MYWNLITIENTKNLRRRMLWVEMVLLSLFVIAIFLFLFMSIKDIPDGVTISDEDLAEIPHLITWPGSFDFALRFVAEGNLGELLLVVFVGAVTASEYTWRTLRLSLSRGIPRFMLLGAKFTALLIPSLMIMLAGLAAGAAITAFFSIWFNGTLAIDQIDLGRLVLNIGRSTYAMLPYAALTFLLAVTFRSAVVAIGGGLAFSMLIETFLIQVLVPLDGIPGQVGRIFPKVLTTSLIGGTESALLEPLHAAVGIGLWTLSLLTLALLIFQRQDISG